ncbi:hypothetical protein LB505_003548 [Fusarium chuoi]|nr:hypothetical protein LB505_003548 [Fusarium chuoi]
MSEPQQSQPSQDEQPNEKDSVGARLQSVETGASYEPPPMKTLQRRLVVLSLCLTLFLCALDTTILATALPTIGKELHHDDFNRSLHGWESHLCFGELKWHVDRRKNCPRTWR